MLKFEEPPNKGIVKYGPVRRSFLRKYVKELVAFAAVSAFFAGDYAYVRYYVPWHEEQQLKVQHETFVRKYNNLPPVPWRVGRKTKASAICKKKLSEAGCLGKDERINKLKIDACEEVFEKRNPGVDPNNLEAKLVHGYNGMQF